MGRCEATTKTTGLQCKNSSLKGTSRCRIHSKQKLTSKPSPVRSKKISPQVVPRTREFKYAFEVLVIPYYLRKEKPIRSYFSLV